jgi:hypothetical protein
VYGSDRAGGHEPSPGPAQSASVPAQQRVDVDVGGEYKVVALKSSNHFRDPDATYAPPA